MAPSLAGTGGEVGIILLRVPFGKRGGPARTMHAITRTGWYVKPEWIQGCPSGIRFA